MHSKNLHKDGYDLKMLASSYEALSKVIIVAATGEQSIDFSDYNAVKILNEALLSVHYNINSADLPDHFLIPPVPGRVDYIHHLSDLIEKDDVNVLDIGTGASLIYPLLGAATYGWKFKAVDINEESIAYAKKQLLANTHLTEHISIEAQPDRGSIFKNAIGTGETFTLTMCNPPFYASQEEAQKANITKNKSLGIPAYTRNFQGTADEIWCNGGEALFIKRMIKESVLFKSQVKWFTTLVSKSDNLPKIYKQLDKLKAHHKTVPMSQGKKKSRFVAWTFDPQ